MIKNLNMFNEESLIKTLNGKHFYELTIHLQKIIKRLFNNEINNDSLIEASLLEKEQKANILIKIGEESKYLFFTTKTSPDLEIVLVNDFVNFMKKHKVSQNIISTFLLYHYGDGSEDGTGEEPLNPLIFYEIMKNRLTALNHELNENDVELRKVMIEAIFKYGFKSSSHPVDAYYQGTANYGEIIESDKLITYFIKWKNEAVNGLYIGPAKVVSGINKRRKNNFSNTIKDLMIFNVPLLYSCIYNANRNIFKNVFITKRYNNAN